jgi:hypothetical protein
MLVGRVVQDELGDDAQPPPMRLTEEHFEVLQRAAIRVNVEVVGRVVPVVLHRRRVERQEPQRGDAELLEVIELLGQTREIADAVAIRVEERPDPQLVEDGVFVPERIVR